MLYRFVKEGLDITQVLMYIEGDLFPKSTVTYPSAYHQGVSVFEYTPAFGRGWQQGGGLRGFGGTGAAAGGCRVLYTPPRKGEPLPGFRIYGCKPHLRQLDL